MARLTALVAVAALSQFVAAELPSHISHYKGVPYNLPRDNEIGEATFSIPISKKVSRNPNKNRMREDLRHHVNGWKNNKQYYKAPLLGGSEDAEYTVAATFGKQNFHLIVDTGSSDTWAVQKGFKCFNLTSYPETEDECAFGPHTYDPWASKTFKEYPDRNFNISYGDGEFLTGTAGFETVSVGGLTVQHQEIGIVNQAAWNGDLWTSGLLGLCFPNLTSVFKGTDVLKDNLTTNLENYDPFFFTAVREKKVKNPYFSIALNRGTFAQENNPNVTHFGGLGYVSFGGYAPVPTTDVKVTVPLQGYKTRSRGTGYFYYIANIDEYIFPGSEGLDTKSHVTILDSGTTLNLLPTEVIKAYFESIEPRPQYDDHNEIWFTTCNANVPEFKVVIGGKAFTIPGGAKDQLLPLGTKNEKGEDLCLTGTQDGGPLASNAVYILGDVFLHNVVATFNIHDNWVHLAQRTPY